MGVAGFIFDPHPTNFENLYNFERCSNDIKMIFWYLYSFQIFKDQSGSVLSIPVAVLELCQQESVAWLWN